MTNTAEVWVKDTPPHKWKGAHSPTFYAISTQVHMLLLKSPRHAKACPE